MMACLFKPTVFAKVLLNPRYSFSFQIKSPYSFGDRFFSFRYSLSATVLFLDFLGAKPGILTFLISKGNLFDGITYLCVLSGSLIVTKSKQRRGDLP
ncbi:hypothetical protein CDAR_237931 [Caerostris darwini]|uniref:Uncharacterized protein n=1 Tax=Caerostris darwini TaxID=1538125 RepID=A0AAV4S0N5_9ARAC|nr:hypothetical protein CDAR_237931 [Caerostris darwini]